MITLTHKRDQSGTVGLRVLLERVFSGEGLYLYVR